MSDSRLDVEVKKAIKVRYGKVSELGFMSVLVSYWKKSQVISVIHLTSGRSLPFDWTSVFVVDFFFSVHLEGNDNYLPVAAPVWRRTHTVAYNFPAGNSGKNYRRILRHDHRLKQYPNTI